MMGPSWGQWVTQIKGDYLFHSVYYNSKNNNNNLSVRHTINWEQRAHMAVCVLKQEMQNGFMIIVNYRRK